MQDDVLKKLDDFDNWIKQDFDFFHPLQDIEPEDSRDETEGAVGAAETERVLLQALETDRQITEIKERAAKEARQIRQKLREIDRAVKARENATEGAGSPEQAQAMKETRQARRALYGRLQALEHGPLISAEEYNRMAGVIKNEYYRAERKTCELLADLARAAESIANNLADAQEAANKSLYSLQKDVYRNADRHIINERGTYSPESLQRVGGNAVIDWGLAMVEHEGYREYIKSLENDTLREHFGEIDAREETTAGPE